jgi:hypothetical protein
MSVRSGSTDEYTGMDIRNWAFMRGSAPSAPAELYLPPAFLVGHSIVVKTSDRLAEVLDTEVISSQLVLLVFARCAVVKTSPST